MNIITISDHRYNPMAHSAVFFVSHRAANYRNGEVQMSVRKAKRSY